MMSSSRDIRVDRPDAAVRGDHVDGLSEEEGAVVALVREFVDREVRPSARDLEHGNVYPDKLIEQMKEMGIFGLAIPAPWGEAQVSAQCYSAVTEELARGGMSLAGATGGHTVVAKLLVTYGTPDQKDAWLPRMATGEVRATMALTEPGGGSDLQAMRTTARRDGEEDVVNGAKTWITNARRSQLIALLCKTDPSAVPSQMMRGLEIGRIQVASRALGVARAALEDSLRYAQQRESFGKPIWQHQSVGNYLADMATKLQAARQLTLY